MALAIAACGPNDADDGGDDGGDPPADAGLCATACTGSTPICDADTGQCVACTADNDLCPTGEVCQDNTCVTGCAEQADCNGDQVCDTTAAQCVDCTRDEHCALGTVCDVAGGTCVAGCSAEQACPAGQDCCDSMCFDLQSDLNNCGVCGNSCPDHPNTEEACNTGQCAVASCDVGYADCNLNPADGCEVDTTMSGLCLCTPGETASCYEGPPGTEGVGTCTSGTTTCLPSGLGWSVCVGQIVPSFDECADGFDQDCNGTPDDPPDLDGDGWTACQGDCCDDMGSGCGDPILVNPGAFEVDGNTVDDDCDGIVDNPLPACDTGLASNSATGMDYAQAMDLCATAVELPPTPDQQTWGVISATFHQADGAGTPAADSRSIRTGYGSGVAPMFGNSLTVLSSGVAAAQSAPNNTAPNWVAFQTGLDMVSNSGVPSDWLAANGNIIPNAPGCPDPIGGATANDPIMLKLRIRVPTNANSFSVNSLFYSSEYPEWVCSPYNDFLLVLIDSTYPQGTGPMDNPLDKNLAIYTTPGGVDYPVGVNLASGNTGLFTQCLNGETGCGVGSVLGNNNTCVGTNLLTGTGFDIVDPAGACGTSDLVGGATSWLTTSGNVVPGEIIELRFVIWDTGDAFYDSVVLFDNFQWSVTASTPGTDQAAPPQVPMSF